MLIKECTGAVPRPDQRPQQRPTRIFEKGTHPTGTGSSKENEGSRPTGMPLSRPSSKPERQPRQ